ncbi:MAG: homoserine O-acetyltransferase [Kiritimatiellia bacterium]
MPDNSSREKSVGIVETRTARIGLPPEGFVLESGESLPELTIAYESYGTPSDSMDNAVYICHALTGDAHVAGYHSDNDTSPGWWDQMVGPGKGIDTDYYHVICSNMLGGCAGTTGPSSINPATGRPYGSAFPRITVTDIVRAQKLLMEQLGIRHLAAVIGGSFGGMQALEWAILYPDMVERCVCAASAASLSAQALAFDIVARDAIVSDPGWQGGEYYDSDRGPEWGLAHARKIGHITYLSPVVMQTKFGRQKKTSPETTPEARHLFEVENYLNHQGRKLVNRFDANSYVRITDAMDAYDLVERFGALYRAFDGVKARFLVVALSSDWLFPPEQSIELANGLLQAGKRVSCCTLQAPHGHDAFLMDVENLNRVIRAFLPWVPGTARDNANARECVKRECAVIADMIPEGARVLDLGCGDGSLLSLLERRKHTVGTGADINIRNVIEVIDRGHDVFHGDVDAGLAIVPDGAYDAAILSETLQVLQRPRFVLREMLRIAGEGVVSFPNFGRLDHRLRLTFKGRVPEGGASPHEWYHSPNIHPFTCRDFIDLCKADGIEIVSLACIPGGVIGAILTRFGLCNLTADRVVARITRGPDFKVTKE